MNGGGNNFSQPMYISPFSSQIALLNKTEIWNKKVGTSKTSRTLNIREANDVGTCQDYREG